MGKGSGQTQYTKQSPLFDYGTGDDTVVQVLTYAHSCSPVMASLERAY